MRKKDWRRESSKIRAENRRLKRGRIPKGKVLKIFAILILLVGVLWGTHSLWKAFWKALITSPDLTVKNLRVLGDYPDIEEIKDRFNRYCLEKYRSKEPNILEIDLNNLRRHLETLPKVDKVKIRRQFPETIFIEVKRRIPTALIPGETSILGCDGVRVFEIDLSSKYDLPFITGLKKGHDGDIKRALEIIQEIKNVTPSLSPIISEINVSDPQNLFVYTTDGIRIYFGDINNYDLKERLTRLKGILDYSQRGYLTAEYVDLRFDRIVVRPRG